MQVVIFKKTHCLLHKKIFSVFSHDNNTLPYHFEENWGEGVHCCAQNWKSTDLTVI